MVDLSSLVLRMVKKDLTRGILSLGDFDILGVPFLTILRLTTYFSLHFVFLFLIIYSLDKQKPKTKNQNIVSWCK